MIMKNKEARTRKKWMMQRKRDEEGLEREMGEERKRSVHMKWDLEMNGDQRWTGR